MEEKGKRGREFIWKIIAENFSNWGKELDIEIHGANRTAYYLNTKIFPIHISMKTVFKKISDKERILTSAREKRNMIYKGTLLDYQWISHKKLYRPGRNGMLH